MKGHDGLRGEENREDTSDELQFGALSFATLAYCVDLRECVLAPERNSMGAHLWVEFKKIKNLHLIVIAHINGKTAVKRLSHI